MNKLEEIQVACKYGMLIGVNNNIGEDYLAEVAIEEIRTSFPLCTTIYLKEEVERDILRHQKLIVIKLQIDAYTPRFIILHHNFSQAIDQAWEVLKENKFIT